jgi:hypothetical protein
MTVDAAKFVYSVETVPFPSRRQCSLHFSKHGHHFGAADEQEYERLADAFMSQPMYPDLYECVNPTGMNDRNRLDGATRYFGVAYNVTVLRTFHIRDAGSIAYRGGPLGFVTHKCSEVFP